MGEIYEAVRTTAEEPDVDGDCGEAGELLDVELERILYETEQRTIEYLRQSIGGILVHIREKDSFKETFPIILLGVLAIIVFFHPSFRSGLLSRV
ncbi:hypothetical protein [Paenibacillus etheri]|uniref:hypothetical protein n=1 Tax=Paenibacillus etheri TaxID=1306852 RepID=UPI000A875D5C|nr:hypothetical protein [Paenibacillus etheri]